MHSPSELAETIFCQGCVADADELATFAARTFEETYADDNKSDDMRSHLAKSFGRDQQAAELGDPLVATILARANDGLVAYAQVRQNAPPTCVTHADPIELHRFYVDQRAHGSGLATRLMQAVRQAAIEMHGRHLWLSVWEQNPRAIAFYKKESFADVGSTYFMVGPDKQVDRVLVASVYPGNHES